jgi:hypothetical protein
MPGNGVTLADLSGIEAPSPLERIGRGMMDVYQPTVSACCGMTDPGSTAADLKARRYGWK